MSHHDDLDKEYFQTQVGKILVAIVSIVIFGFATGLVFILNGGF